MYFLNYGVPDKACTLLRINMVPAWWSLLLTFILFAGCMGNKPEGFEQRLADLRHKIDMVETSLQLAEGLAQAKGQINLQIAKYFADYIAWELEHPDIMKDAFFLGKSHIIKKKRPAVTVLRLHDPQVRILPDGFDHLA